MCAFPLPRVVFIWFVFSPFFFSSFLLFDHSTLILFIILLENKHLIINLVNRIIINYESSLVALCVSPFFATGKNSPWHCRNH